MPFYRCPGCSTLYVDNEIEQGVCSTCKTPLGPSPGPLRDDPAPVPPDASGPRRFVPFLLGLFLGCLIGAAALWAAWRMGVPLPGGEDEQTPTAQAIQAQKEEADNQVRKAETDRQAATTAHAKTVKDLDAAKQQTTAVQKQKADAEQQLRDALTRLAKEQGQRAALEKALAEMKKPALTPMHSFVRNWQLLGPFPSADMQGHDTVFPPEREPFQIKKAYNGFGGPVKWRPYHSAEDKIDLANFFKYQKAGAAFAVSWVFSDRDQIVTLGVGSDDGIRLWVNGAKVHDIKGGRQAQPGQDRVKVRLKKGWNEIRAKVDNIIGTWELYLEFRTEDGRQALKLFTTSTPPPAVAR